MGVYEFNLDEGNGWVKFGDGTRYRSFVHALRHVKGYEREKLVTFSGNQGAPPDYIEVHANKRAKTGDMYVTAETALKSGFREFESGARRYRAGYYDVLALRAMNELLKDKSFEAPANENEIVMIATHAPQDSHFAEDIVNLMRGWHTVTRLGTTCHYNITHVETVDEPVAGLFCYTLDADGKPYKKDDLWKTEGDVLVIDIGAYTTDFQEADKRGVPRPGAKSKNSGVNKAKEVFRDLMRQQHSHWLINGDSVTESQIDDAFRTIKNKQHIFKASGREVDCTEQVDTALAPLMNELLSVYYNDYQGGSPYGTILLDGGGAGLLHQVLRDRLDHGNIHLADSLKTIQLANARGAGKLLKMLRRKGYV